MPLILKLVAYPGQVLSGRTHTVIEHIEYFSNFIT